MTLTILFEDNHIIVAEKPANMPVQEDMTGDYDFLSAVKDYIKVSSQKPGNVYLGLVHRLDRPVGGVMVFAKTSKAASRLSEQIREHKMEKNYVAKIVGKLKNNQGTLSHFLVKDEKKSMAQVFDYESYNSKKSELTYNVLSETASDSIVRVNLITGRFHQIRAQFSHIGHPLVGDYKYGDKINRATKNLFLFSCFLKFKHPVKDEILEFELLPSWIN